MPIKISLTVDTLDEASVITAAAGTLTGVSDYNSESVGLPRPPFMPCQPHPSSMPNPSNPDPLPGEPLRNPPPDGIEDFTIREFVDELRFFVFCKICDGGQHRQVSFEDFPIVGNLGLLQFLQCCDSCERPEIFESIVKLNGDDRALLDDLQVYDLFKQLGVTTWDDVSALKRLTVLDFLRLRRDSRGGNADRMPDDLYRKAADNFLRGEADATSRLVDIYVDLYRRMNPDAEDSDVSGRVAEFYRNMGENNVTVEPHAKYSDRRRRLPGLHSMLTKVFFGDCVAKFSIEYDTVSTSSSSSSDVSTESPRRSVVPKGPPIGGGEDCVGHDRGALQSVCDPDSPFPTLADEEEADACAARQGAANAAFDREWIVNLARVAMCEEDNDDEESSTPKRKSSPSISWDKLAILAGLLPPDWTHESENTTDDDDEAISPLTAPLKPANDSDREWFESLVRMAGVDEREDEKGDFVCPWNKMKAPFRTASADSAVEGGEDTHDNTDDSSSICLEDMLPFLGLQAISDANDRKWLTRMAGLDAEDSDGSDARPQAVWSRLEDVSLALHEALGEKMSMWAQLRAAQASNCALEAELAAAHDAIIELHRTATELRASAADGEVALRDELDGLEAELRDARTEVHALQVRAAQSIRAWQGVVGMLADREPALDEAKAELHEAMAELAHATAELDGLRRALESLRVAHVELVAARQAAERDAVEDAPI